MRYRVKYKQCAFITSYGEYFITIVLITLNKAFLGHTSLIT